MHSKRVLEEFIYKLDEMNSFFLKATIWSSPSYGFSYNDSLPKKFMKALREKDILSESMDSVIGVLGDWESVAEGIIFTDRAIYVISPKNTDKRFKVRYDEITNLIYYSDPPKLKIKTRSGSYAINYTLWSKRNIYDFLQFATKKYDFNRQNKDRITNIHLAQFSGASIGAIAAGLTYGSVSNSSSRYFDDKIVSPRGHGFAAEHANHLADMFQGKDAHLVGDDNVKNGPDRIVDGIQIQSKYCSSGSKCIQECFKDGKFRYWNPDGTPMQIEVPSDMYDAAIQALKNRIQNGEVPGVSDPAEAEKIIRKGHFTYAQVRNVAKAGTVESICYDAASGAIIATNTFGITAVLTFATSLWSGEEFEVALKSATIQGLKVGGTTFISAVLAGQLSKAGLNSALVGSSEAIVGLIGPRASAVLVNAFRSGTNIYGAAAMKSAAKLLRSNTITGAMTFAVLSAADVGNIFMGRISGGQLFKNLANTASTVAGGGAGWVAGATAGAAVGSVIPIIGSAAGAFIGGLAGAFGGGSLASTVSGAVLDEFIEDDANKMVDIIQDVFKELAEDYLIMQKEAEQIADRLEEKLTESILKDMYASISRTDFAKDLMEEYFVDISYKRPLVALPTQDDMRKSLQLVLEEMAD